MEALEYLHMITRSIIGQLLPSQLILDSRKSPRPRSPPLPLSRRLVSNRVLEGQLDGYDSPPLFVKLRLQCRQMACPRRP